VTSTDVMRDQARTIARISRALNTATLRPGWS
jgi:hypothetical protein